MTIEQLLEKSTDDLERMTDSELEEYFKPYFTFCRTPIVEGKSSTNKMEVSSTSIPRPVKKSSGSPKVTEAFYEEIKKKAAQMGLKLQ